MTPGDPGPRKLWLRLGVGRTESDRGTEMFSGNRTEDFQRQNPRMVLGNSAPLSILSHFFARSLPFSTSQSSEISRYLLDWKCCPDKNLYLYVQENNFVYFTDWPECLAPLVLHMVFGLVCLSLLLFWFGLAFCVPLYSQQILLGTTSVDSTPLVLASSGPRLGTMLHRQLPRPSFHIP